MARSRRLPQRSTRPDASQVDSAQQTPLPSLPDDVVCELETAYLRIQNPAAAKRMWQRVLTEEDRQRLGDDLEECYARWGTIGIWQQAHGVSQHRAIIEVARGVNLMYPDTADWLLQEIGEYDAVPVADRPIWNARTGELCFAGTVIRRVRVLKQPSNIQCILNAFQALGWPTRIDNPLPHGQQQLNQALRYLNTRLESIIFRSQEGGEAITWERR